VEEQSHGSGTGIATPPTSVTIASVALGIYVVLILLNNALALDALGVREPEALGRAFAKPMLVAIGVTATIVGLRRLRNWAWWVSVLLGSAWTLGGIMTLVEASKNQVVAPSVAASLAASTTTLLTAVLCLLTAEARRAFSRSAVA